MRGPGSPLSAPRLITFIVSLLLVLVAAGSLFVHLPAGAGFVTHHRFWIAVGGYVVLMLGVLLSKL